MNLGQDSGWLKVGRIFWPVHHSWSLSKGQLRKLFSLCHAFLIYCRKPITIGLCESLCMWFPHSRYTIVLMYYALSVGLLFLVRPIISHQFCDGQGLLSIYAALYFLPSLAVLHALFGGLICK